MNTLTLLIPVYNEENSVEQTIDEVESVLNGIDDLDSEIVCIDDGSSDGSGKVLEDLAKAGRIRLLRFAQNRGYGASLKAGALTSQSDWIAMIDADGTYPAKSLVPLVDEMRGESQPENDNDYFVKPDVAMAVGARTGADVNIPLIRRPAKWFLRTFANYLTGARIPDLNSGLRVIQRQRLLDNIRLLPDGFSLTTTITLALLTQGCDVRYLPIDYHKRVGKSSIRPIRDTLKFFQLIIRTTLYFNPLKVFGPAAAALLVGAVGIGFFSKLITGEVMDVTSIVLLVAALQVLATGLLADLISKRI